MDSDRRTTRHYNAAAPVRTPTGRASVRLIADDVPLTRGELHEIRDALASHAAGMIRWYMERAGHRDERGEP